MARSNDLYDLPLTTSRGAGHAYNEGVAALLKVQSGGLETVAASIAMDPTFALGHAALALLGHEYCA
ncbi:MAG: pyridine nucleotide-disulfide oxidoreductase, partial [Propionibacteriales bacterium]|nr:pyridine nucleotide-disulfide oxidoreductase [Propionibacteriales bacterium]